MAPPQPPSGPRRWDAQAQRWVVDQAPAGPPPGDGPGLPPLPSQPPAAPPHPFPSPPPPPYEVPPGPPSPGGPGAGRRGGRWLTPATAGIAVASVAIGAAVVWFAARDTGDADQAQDKHGTVTSAAPTGSGDGPVTGSGSPPTAGPTRTPTPGPTGTGAGPGAHETKQDAAGFTIAVPAGWLREEAEAGVFYRSPDRSALIQVFRVSEPELSPLQAVKQASTYLRSGTRGYQEISVGPVSGSSGAAELVYQYDSEESRGVRRGVERVFLAADGTKWALLTAGPVAEWQLTQDHHAAALAAFRPAG
ncbi:hypothetical protein [Streptomyces sp. NRRL F-2664]|uniref:hypothetical protein n=1 Tax=Streptomyces sp. NRRL F-2664 TaxID=1463842 RepID=UPI00068B2FD2|nr:hypothetical protein [Streptomyces sp. NRRL F-2664]